ncbi:hypothetical protein [Spiroplasma poulsonii]|nr:hypothetical protein [Spiroplasma poulsonii]
MVNTWIFKPAQKQKFKIKHRVEAFTMLINTNQLNDYEKNVL